MAKAKKREVSVHSRAARRGEAPPSKDLLTSKTPTEQSDYKPWLHSAQNSGIQKKQKKKQLTRAQKLRQQKGMERADENAEKLEKKIADSKKRGNAIKKRNPDWEELNAKLVAVKEAQQEALATRFAKLREDSGVEERDRDGDEQMLPNLEQSLPIRSAEMSGAEEEELLKPTQAIPGAPAWVSQHAHPEDLEDIT
ncbi:hypothetical protein AC578_346 [Pseudocercospora eumusae]|uniref:Uncharacterized protein n=1 Tax=Pseudocercospora eumusae TaxID=321146 RepID=A0A139HTY3_9PEZI|nr:hypothetical protein AC578_346 [Pseudocercospora eumusae]